MKIVILDGYQLNPGDLSWEEIIKLGEVEIYDSTSPSQLIERCEDAEIVITNKVEFSNETLALLPILECILVSATGYNIIDTAAAKENGVVVCNAPSYSNESVAQHVFALLFAIYNRVENYSHEVKKGKWASAGDWSYTNEPLANVHGKTMGIIGYGQIGQRVGEIAQCLGMKVIAHHKHPQRDARKGVGFVDLPTLFKEAEVVTLHVPLNSGTKHIVNAESLKLMKSSAVLINTGRGPLVDEAALSEALEAGEIRAAGLDVLSSEPPEADNPLYKCENCFITPHIAWAGVLARKNLMGILRDNIQAFQAGKPANQVN